MPADQPLHPLLRTPTLRREGERDRRISEAEPMTANPFRVDALDVATGHPIEVLPGVYEVRESLAPAFDTPECWVSLFILTDPTGHARPAIIDTGVPRSTDTVILPALAAKVAGAVDWSKELQDFKVKGQTGAGQIFHNWDPNVDRWMAALAARPGVAKGMQVPA